MKVYFFGSPTCSSCHELLEKIGECNLELQDTDEFCLIDALSDEQDEFCDLHKVDELPHVKLVFNNGTLIYEQAGLFDPQIIKDMMADNRKNEE